MIGSNREIQTKREGREGDGTAETAKKRRNKTEAICFTSLEQYRVRAET